MKEIIWTGEKDDLTAKVGKYTLRVERMSKRSWWWAVSYKENEYDFGNATSLLKAKQFTIESMESLDEAKKYIE